MDILTLKRAQKGDRESFTAAILELKDRAYRISYCYLHNEQDSMDAVCNAVEKAFVSIKKLKDVSFFSTWFIRIVINECKLALRKKDRVVLLDEGFDATADTGTEENEESMDLAGVIQKLGQTEQAIIHMKYYQGYTLEEIAEVMSIPLGTVKTKLYGSLRFMKNKLEVRGV